MFKNGYSGFLVLKILILTIVNIIIDLIVLLKQLNIWILLLLNIGINISIRIDIANTINPLNLLLIDRKIEKKNRKYHSGSIWGGVLK